LLVIFKKIIGPIDMVIEQSLFNKNSMSCLRVLLPKGDIAALDNVQTEKADLFFSPYLAAVFIPVW